MIRSTSSSPLPVSSWMSTTTNVGAGCLNEFYRLSRIGGLATDLQIGLGGDVSSQPLADRRVVIHNQDLGSHHLWLQILFTAAFFGGVSSSTIRTSSLQPGRGQLPVSHRSVRCESAWSLCRKTSSFAHPPKWLWLLMRQNQRNDAHVLYQNRLADGINDVNPETGPFCRTAPTTVHSVIPRKGGGGFCYARTGVRRDCLCQVKCQKSNGMLNARN